MNLFLEEHSSYYNNGYLLPFCRLILPYSLSETYMFEFKCQNDKLAAINFGAKILVYQRRNNDSSIFISTMIIFDIHVMSLKNEARLLWKFKSAFRTDRGL